MTRPDNATGLSRREFLVAANAAALLLVLESCNLGSIGRKPSPSPAGVPGGTAYQQALTLMRDAIRASPDHLAQRSSDLVATRDATKIVEFVRDRLSVVPPWFQADDARSARRWGSTAALRGGQGTLRERADLLADMLTRAGFKANVSSAARPSAIGLAELYRSRAVEFTPDTARVDQARKVLRQAGVTAPATPRAVSPGPDPTAELLRALPASAQLAALRADLLPGTVPIVEFQDGSKKRYAFALGDLAITDSPPAGLRPHGDADPLREVTITVSAVSNAALGAQTTQGKVIDIATGRWPADQVVGRQVLLTFVPPQGSKAILDSGLAALPMRVPMLRVQSSSPPVAAGPALIAAGSLITVHGDVLGPSTAPNAPSMPGPFGAIQSLGDADRAAAAARVNSVRVVANSTAFPEIELEIGLADSSGNPVDGLLARDLAIKDQGQAPVGFTLYSNVAAQRRPRVLVVYDAAFVEMWPSASAKSTFESALTAAITAQSAKTPFDVQVVGLGVAPDALAWAAPQAGSFASALTAAHESSDDPWGTVGGPALDQGIGAIVLVSDLDSADTDPARVPTYQRRLTASRVPVFVVPVGNVNQTVAGQIASMSGGARLDSTDAGTPSRIAGLLGPLASGWTAAGYRLRYDATAGTSAQHTVTVALASRGQVTANTTYVAPATPVPAPSFSGLYVTVAIGPLAATRRIAGLELNPRFGSPQGAIDDPRAVAEVRAALDGVTTIAIEPGTPTTAATLGDVVDSFLSLAPLYPIWGSASNDQVLAAVKNGVHRTPGMLPAVLRPTSIDPRSVPGLRVAIFQERAASPSVLEQHVDLAFGLNEVIPIATDRHQGFRSVMATSVAQCAAEAASISDSAYARLSGKPLTAIAAGDTAAASAFAATISADRQTAWREVLATYQDSHLAVPAAGAGDAMWVIDPASGTAKAVLLDSTGGARLEGGCHFDADEAVAFEVAILALECSAIAAEFPFFCVQVNVIAVGMSVDLLFKNKADVGTPVGIILPFLELPEGLEVGVGMMLILITLSSAGCF